MSSNGSGSLVALRVKPADALGLRRAALSLRSGAAGRDKIIVVSDAPPDLADRVARLRDTPP